MRSSTARVRFVSLLLRATSWTPDPQLMFLLHCGKQPGLPRRVDGIPERVRALAIDMPALATPCMAQYGPRLCFRTQPHCRIRCAGLAEDRVESNRLIQAQILFLKSADLLPVSQRL